MHGHIEWSNPSRQINRQGRYLLIHVQKFGSSQFSNFINGLTDKVTDYFYILVNGFGFNGHEKLTD